MVLVQCTEICNILKSYRASIGKIFVSYIIPHFEIKGLRVPGDSVLWIDSGESLRILIIVSFREENQVFCAT